MRLTASTEPDHSGAFDPETVHATGPLYLRLVQEGNRDADSGEVAPLPSLKSVDWLLDDKVVLTDSAPEWVAWGDGGMLYASEPIDIGTPDTDGVLLTARLTLDDGTTLDVSERVAEPQPELEPEPDPTTVALQAAGMTDDSIGLLDRRLGGEILDTSGARAALDAIGGLDLSNLSESIVVGLADLAETLKAEWERAASAPDRLRAATSHTAGDELSDG